MEKKIKMKETSRDFPKASSLLPSDIRDGSFLARPTYSDRWDHSFIHFLAGFSLFCWLPFNLPVLFSCFRSSVPFYPSHGHFCRRDSFEKELQLVRCAPSAPKQCLVPRALRHRGVFQPLSRGPFDLAALAALVRGV